MILKRGRDNTVESRSWRKHLASRTGLGLVFAVVGATFLLGVFFLGGAFAYRQGIIGQGKDLAVEWTNPNRWQAFSAPPLPEITFDMKFKHLRKIEEKRADALDRGILFSDDDDFVPAEITFENRTIRVKMRLKGDTPIHWSTEKWSFRTQVKGDDQVMGMRRFSVQHPMTRNYIDEWGFLETLRQEDILAPRLQFVNVIFNGDDKGIYTMEEFFAKEMIESQGRREGILLIFDEELFWERRDQIDTNWRQYFAESFDPLDYRGMLIRTYGTGRIERNPTLSRQRDEAVTLLRGFQQGLLKPSEVFDVPLLAKYLAVVELWSAVHGLDPSDSPFYYNPITTKLEPVGFDGKPLTDPGELQVLASPAGLLALEAPRPVRTSWTRDALKDPVIAKAYMEEVQRIVSDDYLVTLRESIGGDLERNLLSLHREWPNLEDPWDKLKARQELLSNIINPPLVVQALQINGIDGGVGGPGLLSETVVIQVANLFALPTEVLGFRVADGPMLSAASSLVSDAAPDRFGTEEQSVLLNPKVSGEALEFIDFTVPRLTVTSLEGLQVPAPVVVVNRLVGERDLRETPVTQYSPVGHVPAIPIAPSLEEALAMHPYLQETAEPLMLSITAGQWRVSQDLVLPDGVGLFIGPGTKLDFEADAMLLARGPLLFQGTAEDPIVIGSDTGNWPGIVVLDAWGSSLWQHVTVNNTSGIDRDGWILTGGITFYQSPVTLVQSRLLGSTAEDMINVIRTSFSFTDIEIAGAASDAFDGDFTQGYINSSSFHDIVGDAIDVSGSHVSMQDVFIRNVGDKGVSAGETSFVEMKRITGENLGIGLASKDQSSVVISDSSINGFIHAGIAAYTKKREYGPANVIVNNVTLKGEADSLLIQTGSWIERDGEYLEGTDFDVDELYAIGILGN